MNAREPIVLYGVEDAPRTASPAAGVALPLAGSGIGLAVLAVVVAVVVRRRRLALTPEAGAALRLARLLRLSPAERRVLDRLASLPGTPPAAGLLISTRAMARAVERLARSGASAADVAAAEALARRLPGR